MTRGFAKRFSRGVCALALLAGLGLARSAAAQWVDYPTADVPRNADGTPAKVRAINQVGLERNDFTAAQVDRVKQLHKILYRAGLNRTQALERLAGHAEAASAEFARFLAFAGTSTRGLAPGGR